MLITNLFNSDLGHSSNKEDSEKTFSHVKLDASVHLQHSEFEKVAHQNRLRVLRKELLDHISATSWKYQPIDNLIGHLTGIWGYLFGVRETDESLEKELRDAECYLEDVSVNGEDKEDVVDLEPYTSLHCIGTITKLETDYGLIDEKYYFKNNSEELALKVGDSVSFVVFKQTKSSAETVTKISKVSSWNHPEGDCIQVESKRQLLRKNIACQVVGREARTIFVRELDISFSLDQVKTDFIPYVGDWLLMETVTEIDETVTDLTGDILSIDRIRPLRAKPVCGVVRAWNAAKQTGVIDKDIFFIKDVCEPGYVPHIGDKVVCQAIESNPPGTCYCWRAITVAPTFRTRAQLNPDDKTAKQAIDHLTENKHNIQINENLKFDSMKPNEKRHLTVTITNGGETPQQLIRISFNMKRSVSQLRLVSAKPDQSVTILAGQSLPYEFECRGQFMGNSRELVTFHFATFKIARWFEIVVENESYTNEKYVRKNHSNLAVKRDQLRNREIFRGGRLIKPPAFVSKKMEIYQIPPKLWQAVLGTNSQIRRLDEIKISCENVLPCLKEDLCFQNYRKRFQGLLYLEEIQMHVNISMYSMERVRFVANGEYLMLEVLDLNERRPSLMIGDRILVSNPFNESESIYEGYVHKILAKHVYLKFGTQFHAEYLGQEYNVEFTFMRTSLRRCHQAIGLAADHLGSDFLFPSKIPDQTPQINVIDDETQPTANDCQVQRIDWCNKNLNHHQKMAVKNILKGLSRPLPYMIFGPPGTGKTVTLVEAAIQILRMIPGSRLLITSPSNSSADLIATRLLDLNILIPGDLVRLVAHRCIIENTVPDRLLPYCATGELAREGTRPAQEQIVGDVKMGCSSSVLGRHRITVATCVCFGQLYNMGFARGHFTHVLVDEAGQATEPEVLIPLSLFDVKTSQVVLAGDPLQLGPVVMSSLAEHYGMEESFLVRLTRRFPYERDWQGFPETGGYDPRFVTRLAINYRSVPEILALPSSLFYDSELEAVVSQSCGPEADLLRKLSSELPQRENGPPAMVFHGVRGENLQQNDSPSWYNPHEATQILYYICRLYDLGVSRDDIGIITPYSKQVKEIRRLLNAKDMELPKIASVEEFQGQERKIIILSTVRSVSDLVVTDMKYSLGFIASPRRLNVALTRAQALLIIVGNPHVLGTDPYWRSVLIYCIKNNSYVGCDLPAQYILSNILNEENGS